MRRLLVVVESDASGKSLGCNVFLVASNLMTGIICFFVYSKNW